MKALFYLLLFTSFSVHAQSFTDTSKLWAEVTISINWPMTYDFYRFRGDTVISGHAYQKLYRYHDDLAGELVEYASALREDSTKKVFYVPRGQVAESLLYDFNIGIGDTFLICHHHDIIATSIDTVELVNGEWRKVISFDPGPEYWIEGIGSPMGIISNGGEYYCSTTLEAWTRLNCYFENEELIHKNENLNYPCFPPVNEVKRFEQQTLTIYPNPFTNKAYVILPNEATSGTINIYNITGDAVSRQSVQGPHATIIRGSLSAGIYFYQFVDKDGQTSIGKVIIE